MKILKSMLIIFTILSLAVFIYGLYTFINYLIMKIKYNNIKQRNLRVISGPFYKKLNDTKLFSLTSWMLPKIHKTDNLSLYLPGECSDDYDPINQDGVKDNKSNYSYLTIISQKYKQPIFSITALSSEDINNTKGKRPNARFKTCCKDSIKNSQYKNSGFSRGHNIASSDETKLKCEDDCQVATFSYCNVSPQNQELNGVFWTKIEEAVNLCKNSMIIINGPIFFKDVLVCTNKNACTKLSGCSNLPERDKKKWFANSDLYTDCSIEDEIPVAEGFYRIMINNDTKKIYCIIINQTTPNNINENGSIHSYGIDAYKLVERFLFKNDIELSEDLRGVEYNNVVNTADTYIKKWKVGKCPF